MSPTQKELKRAGWRKVHAMELAPNYGVKRFRVDNPDVVVLSVRQDYYDPRYTSPGGYLDVITVLIPPGSAPWDGYDR